MPEIQPCVVWNSDATQRRLPESNPALEDRIILEIVHALAADCEENNERWSWYIQTDIMWVCRRIAAVRLAGSSHEPDRRIMQTSCRTGQARFLRKHFPAGHPLWNYLVILK